MSSLRINRDSFHPGEDISAKLEFAIRGHDNEVIIDFDNPTDTITASLIVGGKIISEKTLEITNRTVVATFLPHETEGLEGGSIGEIKITLDATESLGVRRFYSIPVTVTSI